jgi:hypothetical protein
VEVEYDGAFECEEFEFLWRRNFPYNLLVPEAFI